MYVLLSSPSWVFTPGPEGSGTLVIPGTVIPIEKFAQIRNVDRNIFLYDYSDYESKITVTDNGADTTITFDAGTSYSDPSETLQVILFNETPGTTTGPTSNVAVTNFPATQAISGTVNVANEIEIKNDAGNPIPITGTVTTTGSITGFPSASTDAFGRLRSSEPFTLFDSSHRYADNGSWAESLTSGGTSTFNASQGLVDLAVTNTIGSSVVRETYKVFSYQPGKSLLVLNTFVLSGAAGIRQRVGYFGSENGYYLERGAAGAVSFVERSKVSGSVVDTPKAQTSWNVDPMNGTGPSGISLDFTKSQILWFDLEWLGVGSVRAGFVVDGKFILAHQFDHANVLGSTYITTACLPLRYEIENISSATSATLKQICSTVISEGGYTLSGAQRSVGTPIQTPYALAVAGTYYPVLSLRLKSAKLDAIALLTGLSLLGAGNNETYAWRVVSRAVTTGGTWNTLSANSSVEYNLTATSVTGGNAVATGFTSASNQGSPVIDIFRGSLFANQLERNGLTGSAYELTIEVAGAGASQVIYASADWEEITS